MTERDFAIAHRGRWSAVHVYDYVGAVRIGDVEYPLRPGDLTLTPAGTTARYHTETHGTHLVVHYFDIAHPKPVRPSSPYVSTPLHHRLGHHRFWAEACLGRIVELHSRPDSDHVTQAAASAALHDLLLWLPTVADNTSTSSATDRAIEAVALYLDEHLGERVVMADLARQVGLSRNHLARRFKARFGVTMPRYLLGRRLELAAELLATTNLAIGNVGDRVGIADPQYFNKQFRSQYGLSPSEFRKGHSASAR